ncbi:hypothetical protein PVAG01_04694 [Phlyctema vagabunda]|uniref:Uncharacterized protein n=1 Tax=Phlyctema vagabunda TaxID=108571 RepID=A0ABR4PIM3_9HELO
MSSAQTSTYPASAASQMSYANDSFDLSSYARTMHQHTQKQMEAASKSARRRAPQSSSASSTLATESSVSSNDSASSPGSQ